MRLFVLYIALMPLNILVSMAQQISIDRGVKAGSIWCFPLVSDSLSYYYLPSTAKLATNEQGLPKFSLLRYVTSQKNDTDNSISEAGGGAVLHFLVLYDTPQETIKKTEEILKNKIGDKVVLKGPMIFKKASYTLISSILSNEQYEVLSTGDAPVLENSTMAFSFELNPKDSKILLESFKTGTSDVSIVFDFTFEGFCDSYQAQLEVNWAKTHQMSDANAGIRVYSIGAEVRESIDYLLKNEAIKLVTIGSSPKLDGLIDRVYTKIIDLLYEPVAPEKLPAESQTDITNSLANAVSKGIREIEKKIPFSFNAAYKRKSIKNEGSVTYDFSGRATVEKHHFVTFNIANIYIKYASNPLIFKDVSLYDVHFQQRQVNIGLDGEVERDFNKMLNNVTVVVKKNHQDSSVTIKEIVLNKEVLKKINTPFVTYLSQGDQDRLLWLEYEYQVTWQLIGGGKITTDWIKDSSPMISLYVPYKRWKVSLEGDLAKLKEQEVSLISVQLNYLFAGQQRSERIKLTPQDNLENKLVELTVPTNFETLDYSITWIKKDGTQRTATGKDKYGIIVIDQIPNP